jgi:DNA polymerase alpha subunit A
MPDPPEPSVPQGVLPRILGTLVGRRRQVKSLMKNPKLTPVERSQYDIRQKALKLTANSMYGCLGFSHSRFFAKPLAMLITSKGRETLQTTVNMAIENKLDVIYGDTDSIMIYTNSDDLVQVKKIGTEMKQLVNKRYRLLEIEIDGLFQKMLLLKKKKYAALVVSENNGKITTSLETKGLEEVRRDWCSLSKDVSKYILNQLFSGSSREDVVENVHNYLTNVGIDVKKGIVKQDKFIIYKVFIHFIS